jgi:GNAT superfamily N-acetyltransferase
LSGAEGHFRPARAVDKPELVAANLDPEARFVVEADGVIAAAGGVLFHYNPPYGDLYMAVAEPMRRRGFGSFLVQELKRVCYESGHVPAARCNVSNTASRATLQKAGMLPCARLLVGDVGRDSTL